MKAIVFDSGSARLDERPDPAPAPGEALVRPTLMGIAPPDLAVLAGRVVFTGVMGHEGVGVVERVNADADTRAKWEGKRVVFTPWVSCGGCNLCARGLSPQCQARTVMGLHRRDGCFAERFTIPAANLVEVPKALADDAALFAGVVAAAVHAARVARIEGKPFVTVLGDGAEGLVTAQVLAALNASVRLLGETPARFTRCEKWGIKHRHVSEVGQRRDQDIVVDCSNTPAGMDLAMHLARPRGVIITRNAPALVPLAGLASRPAGADLAPVVCNELHVVGAGWGNLRDGVDLLARGGVEVSSLITRRNRLSDGVGAFRSAMQPDCVRFLMGQS
ncbi:MAG: alcohol dehydrogenase [Phycisphaerae bacterium]|nr:MAG: alcohol dehydrogenase [Phycisphaerae bacterium]